MALTALGVVRFNLNGRYADRNVANVIDMNVTPQELDRAEAIQVVAGILLDAWHDNIVQPDSFALSEAYTFTDVSWVDLDDEMGSTGTLTETDNTTLPAAGTNSGDPMPGNVAMLVRKDTASIRGFRAGRWYIVGINELNTSEDVPNQLTPQAVAGFQSNFTALYDDIIETDVQEDLNYGPVVVHTTSPQGSPPSYVAQSFVTGFSVGARLATQRRRLR